jgi:hypothetical protein
VAPQSTPPQSTPPQSTPEVGGVVSGKAMRAAGMTHGMERQCLTRPLPPGPTEHPSDQGAGDLDDTPRESPKLGAFGHPALWITRGRCYVVRSN